MAEDLDQAAEELSSQNKNVLSNMEAVIQEILFNA
jgi:hypothetical protein